MMETSIVVAVISAIVTIATVIINSNTTRSKITAELKVSQAVTDERIKTLTEEVRKHNAFAEKIPVMEEQIRMTNHRVDEVEKRLSA
jgi:uncharacterized membrane protein (DUF106 family)